MQRTASWIKSDVTPNPLWCVDITDGCDQQSDNSSNNLYSQGAGSGAGRLAVIMCAWASLAPSNVGRILEEPKVSLSDAARRAVGWQDVDQSISIPLNQLATEKSTLLEALKRRLVDERDDAKQAMITHFGSAG